MNGRRSSRRQAFFPLLLCLIIWAQMLHAQAIVAPSGRTIFNRATMIRSFVRIDRSSMEIGGHSRDSTQYVIPLAIVYGFYPKWSLVAALPYVDADMTARTADETRRQGMNGLADLQLLVQYDGLYSHNAPGGLTRLSGVFGIQAPTGAGRFSAGAFQYTSGLIYEKVVRLNYVFTSDFEYTIATENKRGVTVGDSARFDAVPAYFVISRKRTRTDLSWIQKTHDRVFRNGAYFMLEVNGDWHAHMRNLGNAIANTGGASLSVSPGLQYFLSRDLLLEVSFPIPVVKALNGIQPGAKVSFVFGFRVLL